MNPISTPYIPEEYGHCEICGSPRRIVFESPGVSYPGCYKCREEALEHRLSNIFNQVRMMVPEKELEFILRLLVGTQEDKLERAERLLQEVRESNGPRR